MRGVKIEFRDGRFSVIVIEFDLRDRILLSIPGIRDWYSRYLGKKLDEAIRKREEVGSE